MSLKFKVGDQCIILNDKDGFSVSSMVRVDSVDEKDVTGLPYLVSEVKGDDCHWVSESVLGGLDGDHGATALKDFKPAQPVKSDGGSSSYYFTKLPQHLIDQIVETGGIEIKDIVRYCFDNDADCKDIIKALKRIRESIKGGGKEGTTIEYDLNKIKFFVNEMSGALNEDLRYE